MPKASLIVFVALFALLLSFAAVSLTFLPRFSLTGQAPRLSLEGLPEAVAMVTASGDQSNPDIDNNLVVYQDNRNGNWDIYLYDIETGVETQLTSDPKDQTDPAINGNYIAWVDNRHASTTATVANPGTQTDIYIYNIETGQETRITSALRSQTVPDIDGNYVVWLDYRNNRLFPDVYLYDIAAATETQVSTTPESDGAPRIDGNTVVYHTSTTERALIHSYDIPSRIDTPLPLEGSTQVPDISGNLITYWKWRDPWHGDIYVYDRIAGTEIRLTTDAADPFNPRIYGNRVVWEDRRNKDSAGALQYDIYWHDLESGEETRVTAEMVEQASPAISGDAVVWVDKRSGNQDLYAVLIDTEEPGPVCGDGVCNSDGGETMDSCPADCGVPTPAGIGSLEVTFSDTTGKSQYAYASLFSADGSFVARSGRYGSKTVLFEDLPAGIYTIYAWDEDSSASHTTAEVVGDTTTSVAVVLEYGNYDDDVSIIVTHAPTDAPLIGYNAFLVEEDGDIRGPLISGSQAVEFYDLPPGTYTLTSVNGDDEPLSFEIEDNTVYNAITTKELVVGNAQASTGPVEITVTDSQTGNPITDATVSAFGLFQFASTFQQSAQTDTAGRTRFDSTLVGGGISAWKPGYYAASAEISEGTKSLTVSLEKAATTGYYTIDVVEETASLIHHPYTISAPVPRPIEDALTFLTDPQGNILGPQHTKITGIAVFEHIPLDRYRQTSMKDGYETTGDIDPPTSPCPSSEERNCWKGADLPWPSIDVFLKDAVTGATLGSGTLGSGSVVVYDADGRYVGSADWTSYISSFPIPFDPHLFSYPLKITASSGGYELKTVTLADRSVETITIDLQPAETGTLSLSVISYNIEYAGAGRFIISDQQGNTINTVIVASSRDHSLTLPIGTYTVSAGAFGSNLVSYTREIKTGEEVSIDYNSGYMAGGGDYTEIILTDQFGLPVYRHLNVYDEVDQFVSVPNTNRGYWDAWYDWASFYPEGKYTAVFKQSGYYPLTLNFEIDEGHTPPTIAGSVQRETGSLQLQVIGPDGAPITNAQIDLWDSDPNPDFTASGSSSKVFEIPTGTYIASVKAFGLPLTHKLSPWMSFLIPW